MAGTRWPNGLPWDRPVERRRRWRRAGRPWEIEYLYLDEVVDEAGGWRVSWARRVRTDGDLLYNTLDEAMATIGWVLAQGGAWSEIAADGPLSASPEFRVPVLDQPAEGEQE